jgi:hypothetical protein
MSSAIEREAQRLALGEHRRRGREGRSWSVRAHASVDMT